MTLTINNRNIEIQELAGEPIVISETNEELSIHTERQTQLPESILPNKEKYSLTFAKNSEGIKTVKYEKKLQPKSGITMNLNFNGNTIPHGNVEFYTIKNSTTKRNSSYRLVIYGRHLKLYAMTSRKNSFWVPLTSFVLEEDLTPQDLNIILASAINAIEKYAKKNNKARILGKLSNFDTIDGILNIESSILELLHQTLAYATIDTQTESEIKSFLESYEGRKNDPLALVREAKLTEN